MKKTALLLVVLFSFSGCAGTQLVSKYDEVIDRGVMEFAERFNTHVKNMGDFAGKPEGTYEANLTTYNSLESKLDVLITRASTFSDGEGCALEKKVFDRIKMIMKTDMPAGIQLAEAGSGGTADGCNERLLTLVKQQLTSIKTIHKETDKCGSGKLSCLRPATAKTALAIANQSINAVAVVETAKKPQGGKQ
jgi:hypothetical protein